MWFWQIGLIIYFDFVLYFGCCVFEVVCLLKVLFIKVFFDVFIKDKFVISCIMYIGNEENVREIMCYEMYCFGSDVILYGKMLYFRVNDNCLLVIWFC